jgi:hypothetical protein
MIIGPQAINRIVGRRSQPGFDGRQLLDHSFRYPDRFLHSGSSEVVITEEVGASWPIPGPKNFSA